MAKRNRKSHPTWTDVKAKLDSFDPAGLLGLVQNLYTAQADTRTFLDARFGLTEDVLLPYKRTIEQWLDPDVFGREDISVSKATKAISDYQKAIDQPEGLTELMVFYCEVATDYCDESGCKMRDFGPSCGCLSKPRSWQTPYHPPRGMGLWRALIACGSSATILGMESEQRWIFYCRSMVWARADFAEPSPTSRSLPAWRSWPVACSRCLRRSCRSSNHASIFRPDSLW
jgi:hypothetical protein